MTSLSCQVLEVLVLFLRWFCPELCTFLIYTECEIAWCISLGIQDFVRWYQGMDVIPWHFVRLLKSKFSLAVAGGNYFCLFASDTGEENLGLLLPRFQDTFCSFWQEGKNAFYYWKKDQALISPADLMYFLALWIFFKFVYLFGGRGQREGRERDKENLRHAPELSAQSATQGSISQPRDLDLSRNRESNA